MNAIYPHWFVASPVAGANPCAELKWRVWNRTGSATVVGRVYQFDIGFTTTSTSETDEFGNVLPAVTTMNWMDANSCWRNVVTPVTAYLRQGFFCRADEAVADNASLMVTVMGPTTLTGATITASDSTVTNGGQMFIPANGVVTAAYSTAASTSRIIFMNTASFSIVSNAISSVTGIFNGFGF